VRDLLTRIAAGPSPARDELIARLRSDAPFAADARGDDVTSWPATPVQEQLWLLSRLRDCGPAYSVPFVLRIEGPLDAERLRSAVERVLARHEGLNTRFVDRDGGAVQERREEPLVPAGGPVVEDVAEDTADEVVHAEARASFDLATGPPLRVRLLRVGPTAHRLVLVAHHAVTDGWSTGVLIRELVQVYAGETLSDVTQPWNSHARQAREAADSRAVTEAVAHWTRTLADVDLEAAGVPIDHPETSQPTLQAGTLRFTRTAVAGSPRPEDAARTLGVSPFALYLAAFQLAVGEVAATSTVVTGVPLLNRSGPGAEGLVGPLSNTLPVRVDVGDGPVAAVQATATAVREALAAQEAPVPLIVRSLPSMARRGVANPLFRQLFNMGNLPGVEGGLPMGRGVTVRPVGVPNGTARVGLELTLEETGDRTTGRLEFDRSLHEAETAVYVLEAFLRRLDVLIQSGADDGS